MMLTCTKKPFVGETVVWWSGGQVPWTQGPLYSHSTSRMNKIGTGNCQGKLCQSAKAALAF